MVWKNLESELAEWMKTFTQPGLTFSGARQSIPGFPSDGFRADGTLTNGRVLVALEVEVSHK